MADDSRGVDEPLDFHPCDTPRGMTYYKLDKLTKEQQRELFEQKLEIVRENQKYLNKHPEVRAVVALVLGAVLKARPKIKLRYFLAKYFAENFDKIEETIKTFSVERSSEDFSFGDISKQDLGPSISSSSSSSIESDEPSFLCILTQDTSFDYLQLQSQKEADLETRMICIEIVREILEYVCRDDIVQQVKLFFAGNQSQQYGSDPMLAFPFEDNQPSLSSNDDADASTYVTDEPDD